MVVLANVSIIQNGFGIAMPAVTFDSLTNSTSKIYLSKNQASWYTAVFALFCPIGNLLTSLILDRLGRRDTIYIIGVFFMISWCVMAFSLATSQNGLFAQLLVARSFMGMASGMCTMPISVYAAETCHPKIRGSLTLGYSLTTAIGIMLMYVMGYILKANWRLLSQICIGIAVFPFIITGFLPPSPNWLVMKNKEEKARKSLKYFRGLDKNDDTLYPEFEAEFEKIVDNCREAQSSVKPNFFKLLKEKGVLRPIFFQFGLSFLQMFAGTFIFVAYAAQIPKLAHTYLDPYLLAIILGFIRVVFTVFVGIMLDKFGRRPMALFSGISVTLFLFAFSAYCWIGKHVRGLPESLISVYIAVAAVGMMTIPFTMNAEIHPQRSRAIATGLCAAFGFISVFTVFKIFFTMVDAMGTGGVFSFYGCVAMLWTLYAYLFMPETKGKTLWEIEEFFKKKW